VAEVGQSTGNAIIARAESLVPFAQ
jgi:hypothetical protein